jgi:hypothetical protein
MCVDGKDQIDQHTWHNQRMNTDENATEMGISHEKKWCKNWKYLILMDSENMQTEQIHWQTEKLHRQIRHV